MSDLSQLESACELASRLVNGEVPDERPEMLKQISQENWSTQRSEPFHRFLFAWAKQTQPSLIVETGTHRGHSAIHMALGCSSAKVVSIDNRSLCSDQLREFKLPNVEAVTSDSLQAADRFEDHTIGMLFLDSCHTCEHVSKEIELYVPKLKFGTVVFIDDISMQSEMAKAWQHITFEKRSLPELHCTGFGIFQGP